MALARNKTGLVGSVVAFALLSGCVSTTITSQANLSGDDPMNWTDFVSLPVEVVGRTPTHSQADIAALFPAFHPGADDSGRHIVLYVNPTQIPPASGLCTGTAGFQQAAQQGDSANIAGALCDGGRVITTATGRVRTVVPTYRWLMRDFALIRDQLYQSLAPNPNQKYS